MRISFLIVFTILSISGCAHKYEPCKPLVKTEYVEVKVPVMYELKRPSRPKLTENQSIPSYLNKLLNYTKQLETIIDKTKNNKI